MLRLKSRVNQKQQNSAKWLSLIHLKNKQSEFQMHAANIPFLIRNQRVMGSIPILTERPPLSSSVGRVLQHKAHLVHIARVEQRQLIWLITRRQRSNRSLATILQGRLKVGRQTHYLVIWVRLPAVHPPRFKFLGCGPKRVNTDL